MISIETVFVLGLFYNFLKNKVDNIVFMEYLNTSLFLVKIS